MEASVSPMSASSARELPSYASRSHRSGSNPGRAEVPKASSSKPTFSSPLSRHTHEDEVGNNLASAKQLQRSLTSEKRKDAARKRLLGTMYTKQKDVNRSFSFVAGERPSPDIKFPSVPVVCYKSKSAETRYKTDNVLNTQRNSFDRNKERQERLFHKRRNGSSPEAKSRKISLPEIIMEFNLEASMAANDRDLALSRADTEDDERAFGVPYEEFLGQQKYMVHNPCRARYRPVTPGLLESLNKSKVPSKVKTEQWVRSIQTSRKSYCGTSYQFGNLDNSNLAVPNWIYEYR